MSSTTNKNVCKTDESSCLFLSYACFLSLLCVFLSTCERDSSLLYAWLSLLYARLYALVSLALYSNACDFLSLCTWSFTYLCTTFLGARLHDLSLLCGWLCALVCVTLRSRAIDFSSLCAWSFTYLCATFSGACVSFRSCFSDWFTPAASLTEKYSI